MVANNKLQIFDNFEIDRSLPKYSDSKEVVLSQSLNGQIITSINTGTFGFPNGAIINFGAGSVPANNWNLPFEDSVDNSKKKSSSFFEWIRSFGSKRKFRKGEEAKTMTIVNFFSSLAMSLQDLPKLQDIALHYETAITSAQKAGQQSLVETLKKRLDSAKSEAQLVTYGLNKYLLEEQVVDFYKKTANDKKLKLTWIKHFVKPIPSKILEIKLELDQKFVFDNYVILHYDPNNDATDLTEVEKKEVERRRKDPILFGVISGSRRLYYVGDWIDDYCNLTLDVVLETLQERVNEVNNKSVKTYIDLGERKENRQKIEREFKFVSPGTKFKEVDSSKTKKDKKSKSDNDEVAK